jgi:hypothetical protein
MSKPIDPLDQLLREQNAYVDDNGFTARVLESLPRRKRFRFRPVILLMAIVVNAVLAIRWLPWKELPLLDLSVVTDRDMQLLLPWLLFALVVGSLVWSLFRVAEED